MILHKLFQIYIVPGLALSLLIALLADYTFVVLSNLIRMRPSFAIFDHFGFIFRNLKKETVIDKGASVPLYLLFFLMRLLFLNYAVFILRQDGSAGTDPIQDTMLNALIFYFCSELMVYFYIPVTSQQALAAKSKKNFYRIIRYYPAVLLSYALFTRLNAGRGPSSVIAGAVVLFLFFTALLFSAIPAERELKGENSLQGFGFFLIYCSIALRRVFYVFFFVSMLRRIYMFKVNMLVFAASFLLIFIFEMMREAGTIK